MPTIKIPDMATDQLLDVYMDALAGDYPPIVFAAVRAELLRRTMPPVIHKPNPELVGRDSSGRPSTRAELVGWCNALAAKVGILSPKYFICTLENFDNPYLPHQSNAEKAKAATATSV